MKIISNFKDYYDYLSGIYGVDDRIVYVRNTIPSGEYKTTHHLYHGGESSIIVPNANVNLSFPRSSEYRYRYLVVLGKRYLCVQKNCQAWEVPSLTWEIFNPQNHNIFNEKTSKAVLPFWLREKPKVVEYYLGSFDQQLVELSKLLQQPVFFIDSFCYNNTVHVNKAIPVLKDLHFGSIMLPEQLYQELEYFIGNTLRANPDIAPPVNVADKDLIVAKGFDLKSSFRKRKEGK